MTAPTYTPPVVYAAVPGPPPRPNSQNTGPTSGPPPTSQNNQNSGPAPASPSVTVAVSMPPAEILEEMEYAQQEEREETPPLYTKGGKNAIYRLIV